MASCVIDALSLEEREKDSTKCSSPRIMALASLDETLGSHTMGEHSSIKRVVKAGSLVG